ncbi:MAG: L-rhamnose mutarotase [Haloarculaceae archaeon]
MSEDTERAVYLQRIDPDRRDEYIRAHDDVPDGVTDAMERGGVEEFELYVRGDIAVCLLEAADIDAYLEAVTGDPDVEQWERHVAQFKREGVDVDAPPDEQIPFMDRIWEFRPD